MKTREVERFLKQEKMNLNLTKERIIVEKMRDLGLESSQKP